MGNLVLARKLHEGIVIGDAYVRVEKIGKTYISLSVDAPDDIEVLRDELVRLGVRGEAMAGIGEGEE